MSLDLFPPETGLRVANALWYHAKDGAEGAREIFHRHYSYRPYRDGRAPKLFVGPGEKMVLVGRQGSALFCWRKFISGDGQQGINCSVFRNESDVLASQLILSAEEIARARWGNQRLFTYVHPRKVRSENPGYCFRCAGWSRVGVTKDKGLFIFAKEPL